MMNKQLQFLGVLLLAAVAASCTKSAPTTQEKKTLHIYTWSNYFNPAVVKAFEEKTGAKIEFSYFSSNEELLAKLQAGARGYDLVVPSSYFVRALKTLGLIEPLGKLDWPELDKLIPRMKAPLYDPTHEYVIPYAWATTGIAVNRARLKDKVDSWSWLFDHPELKGQLTMIDDSSGVVGIALKYLGYSINESSPEAFAKVKQLLIRQKKLLKSYVSEAQPVLEKGEVAASMVYSEDALQVKRKNPNIEFVFPKEGGEIFMDNLAIPKGAPSPDLAREFIRFTLTANVSLMQVQFLLFSPVVNLIGTPGADSVLTNPVINPSDKQLEKYESIIDNPERMEAIEKLWTELKSS